MADRNTAESNVNPDFTKRVTIRDIAQAVGVSHTTVSMALSNHPRISEKRRKEIRAKAEEMGYVPDPMLKSLMRYRSTKSTRPVTAAIAWLNLWDDPDLLRKHKEFDLWWQGASEAAHRWGYRIDEFVTKGLSGERLTNILKTRNIHGVLIPPYRDPPTINLADIPWEDFTVMQLGRHANQYRMHYVTSSQAANTVMAFDNIRARGYKRIGFVSAEVLKSRMFGAGFYWTQHYLPRKERLTMLELDPVDRRKQITQLSKWIEKEKPDAILTDFALLLQELTELDYCVPDDIAVATTSIHDTPITAGIDQNPKEIGRMGFIALASMINDHEYGIPNIQHEILVGGTWVDGDTLPGLIE